MDFFVHARRLDFVYITFLTQSLFNISWKVTTVCGFGFQ